MKVRHVILAGSLLLYALGASLATFRYLDDNKRDTARAKAEQIVTYGKTYSVRHDGKHVEDLDVLVPYADDGRNAFIDPWGKPFQFRYDVDPQSGKEKFVVWTVLPGTGKVLAAPREYDTATPDMGERFRDYVDRVLSPSNPLPLVLMLLGLVGLHVGLFLHMKATYGPPRFRESTGRDLAMASGLAWVIATALFVVFALLS